MSPTSAQKQATDRYRARNGRVQVNIELTPKICRRWQAYAGSRGMSLTAILAICAIEPFGLKAVTFEVVSAIATVGLSLGLTPQLSAASRVILILLMYAGRIGGLSFVLLFSERRSEPPLDRPTGKILIG